MQKGRRFFEICLWEHYFILGFNDLSKMNARHTPELSNIKKKLFTSAHFFRVVVYVNTFFSRATNIPTLSTRFNVSSYTLKKSSVNDWVLLTNDFLLISQTEFTYVQFVQVNYFPILNWHFLRSKVREVIAWTSIKTKKKQKKTKMRFGI